MEVSGKANGITFSEMCDEEQNKQILQPFTHILQSSEKDFANIFIRAFNYWLKVPADKFALVKDVFKMMINGILLIDDIHDNSILRGGIPVAHSVYGVPSTLSAIMYVIYTELEKVLSFNHPEAATVFTKYMLLYHRGQALLIYWRNNYICPSVEEYLEICKTSMGSLFMFGMLLLQLFSENKVDFTKLLAIFGQYIQIRNDYCNLWQQECLQQKGYGEDITEGKFSFPIIHAIMSHPDDKQLIYILRQRTQDVEVKKYFISLLEKYGSFSHTRHTLEKLEAEIRIEVYKLGGNPMLEDILDELQDWKRDTDKKNPDQ